MVHTRKLALVATGAGLALVTLVGPAGADSYPPQLPPVKTVDVSDSRVAVGDTFDVTAGGLAPGSTATLYVTRGRQHGVSSFAGTATVDADGVVTFDLEVPPETAPGIYFVTVMGTDSNGDPVLLRGVFAVLPSPAASMPPVGTDQLTVAPLGMSPVATPPAAADLQVSGEEEDAVLSELDQAPDAGLSLDGTELVVARGTASAPNPLDQGDDSSDMGLRVAGAGVAAAGIVVVAARKRRTARAS